MREKANDLEIIDYSDVFRLTPMEKNILDKSGTFRNRQPGYKKSIRESVQAVLDSTFVNTEEGIELSVYDKLAIAIVGRTIEKGTVKDLKELSNLLGETKEVKVKEYSYDALVSEGKVQEEY